MHKILLRFILIAFNDLTKKNPVIDREAPLMVCTNCPPLLI
jgi:hypothetical protein